MNWSLLLQSDLLSFILGDRAGGQLWNSHRGGVCDGVAGVMGGYSGVEGPQLSPTLSGYDDLCVATD